MPKNAHRRRPTLDDWVVVLLPPKPEADSDFEGLIGALTMPGSTMGLPSQLPPVPILDATEAVLREAVRQQVPGDWTFGQLADWLAADMWSQTVADLHRPSVLALLGVE